MNTKIKLIIFDWDDVFTLGAKEGYFKCYHQTLKTLGVTLPVKEERRRLLAKWGQTHREELRLLLKEKPRLLNRACAVYEKFLFGNMFVDSLKLVPGSLALLRRLKKHYRLALATGVNPKIMKKRIMPKFKIPNVFSPIIFTYNIANPKHYKPSPYIANQILKICRLPASAAMMVGDAANDVKMAESAHITPVVVLTGHLNKTTARRLGVKHIISDVTKLESVLKKVNR